MIDMEQFQNVADAEKSIEPNGDLSEEVKAEATEDIRPRLYSNFAEIIREKREKINEKRKKVKTIYVPASAEGCYIGENFQVAEDAIFPLTGFDCLGNKTVWIAKGLTLQED